MARPGDERRGYDLLRTAPLLHRTLLPQEAIGLQQVIRKSNSNYENINVRNQQIKDIFKIYFFKNNNK